MKKAEHCAAAAKTRLTDSHAPSSQTSTLPLSILHVPPPPTLSSSFPPSLYFYPSAPTPPHSPPPSPPFPPLRGDPRGSHQCAAPAHGARQPLLHPLLVARALRPQPVADEVSRRSSDRCPWSAREVNACTSCPRVGSQGRASCEHSRQPMRGAHAQVPLPGECTATAIGLVPRECTAGCTLHSLAQVAHPITAGRT